MERRRWLLASVVAGSVGLGTVLGATVLSPAVGLAADGDAVEVVERCVGRIGGAPLDAAADAIGIPTEEMLDRLHDGETIADVAEASDVPVGEVVDAMVAAERDALEEAVADGELSRQQADTLAEGMRDRITDLVNGDLAPFPREAFHPAPWGFGEGPFAVAAEAIGLAPAELAAEMADGATIAEVAEANDVPADDIVDAIAAAERQHLDEAVEDGWLSRDRADEIAADAEEHARAIVEGDVIRVGIGRGPFDGRTAGLGGFDHGGPLTFLDASAS